MSQMLLGAPILSPTRMQWRRLAVFAAWDDARALDAFLASTPLGRRLERGGHVRMQVLRRWGRVSEFDDLPSNAGDVDPAARSSPDCTASRALPWNARSPRRSER